MVRYTTAFGRGLSAPSRTLPVSRRVLSCFEERPNCGAGAARTNVEKTNADNMASSEATIIAFFMNFSLAPIPYRGGHYQSK